jgi:death-on-curing family protein
MEETKKGEIIFYKDYQGAEIKVRFEGDTFWATLDQIADFFGRDKSVISRHLSSIFREGELDIKSAVAKNATVQMEGKRLIKRQIEYYNLDAIISVGYRVSSKVATKFRVWATQRLSDYLVKGFAVNHDRLKEAHQSSLKELQQTTRLFQNVLESQRAQGYEKDLLNIILDYANTWAILSKFDAGSLDISDVSKKAARPLRHAEIQKSIERFKVRLMAKKEASDLFGKEVGGKFEAVLGSIYQTFNKKELYASIEEKAAHLFYFAIKDHPFVDGNKRIASLLFLLFLVENNYLMGKKGERKINDTALVALALLIAESKPEQKDVMVKLVVNMINKK